MSSIKKNSNFNIFKKNLISPFSSCLNGNGNHNLIAKTNKINTITKSKIMSNKPNKSSLPFPKNSNYITLISPKNTSSLFLDHTFMTSKSIVLSKNSIIKIKITELRDNTSAYVLNDGIPNKLESGDIVEIKKSDKITKIIKLEDRSFVDTVRENLS